MSQNTQQAFDLEDEFDMNIHDNEVFHVDEEDLWINELRSLLERGCDLGTIRNIGKCRPLPEDLRLSVWKVCLNTNETCDYVDSDVFDLQEQNLIREDVLHLVRTSKINQDVAASKMSDVEAVITFHCKKFKRNYDKKNGWIELLKPLITLNYKDRAELYALFSNIYHRYIPKSHGNDGTSYHLFRLLLCYHDPNLCSFFDSKNISPDTYAHTWFQSLFAEICSSDVLLHLWDRYFQHADQFFIFFLALVLLMFAKEQIFEMADKNNNEIIELLSKTPSNLTIGDLEDFCSLANHYATNTPQSFRKEFDIYLFNDQNKILPQQKDNLIEQTLCLPVAIQELLQANQLGGTAGVRYFIIDCRPAEQYNSKHLYTAFHLDTNLLLKNPNDFANSVDAILTAQKHAIEAGSTAGGEHLCFMGSGKQEEDKYLHMVIAYFLQRNIKYVSMAIGGYEALAKNVDDPTMITKASENPSLPVKVATPKGNTTSIGTTIKQNLADKLPVINTQTAALFSMISSAVKTKSIEVKDKVKDYINQTASAETNQPSLKHVSKQDNVNKLYRQNQQSVFSLDSGDDEAVTDETNSVKEKNKPSLSCRTTPTVVDMESWFLRSDILHKYECEHIEENNRTYPSILLVSSTHLFILRKLPEHKTMANLVVNRALETITKITSKKKCPEILTFHYGTKEDEGDTKVQSATTVKKHQSIEYDKVYLPDAGDAAKTIKLLIVKILNMFDIQNEVSST